MIGYGFKCVFTNPAVVYDHDKFSPHPFRKNFNPQEANDHMAQYDGKPLPFLN